MEACWFGSSPGIDGGSGFRFIDGGSAFRFSFLLALPIQSLSCLLVSPVSAIILSFWAGSGYGLASCRLIHPVRYLTVDSGKGIAFLGSTERFFRDRCCRRRSLHLLFHLLFLSACHGVNFYVSRQPVSFRRRRVMYPWFDTSHLLVLQSASSQPWSVAITFVRPDIDIGA